MLLSSIWEVPGFILGLEASYLGICYFSQFPQLFWNTNSIIMILIILKFFSVHHLLSPPHPVPHICPQFCSFNFLNIMPTRKLQMGWKVLTFWYVMLYSLADVHQHSCEISVDFYWTVCHYVPEVHSVSAEGTSNPTFKRDINSII